MRFLIAGILAAISSEPEVIPASEPTLAYLGPETLMPVASALAAFGGLILLFWRRMVGLMRRLGRTLGKRGSRRSSQ